MQFSHFRHAQCFSSKSYEAIPSGVSRLLLRRGPSAVTRFVIAVVVFALNGVFGGWAFSHVGEEIFEPIPRFAQSDSTIDIPISTPAVWIRGAGFHVSPAPIGSRESLSMSSQARDIDSSCAFFSNAPARFRLALSALEVCHKYGRFFSTVTLAPRLVGPTFLPDYLNNNEASYAGTYVDFCGCIRDSIFRLIHNSAMLGFSAGLLASTGGRRVSFLRE